MNSTAMTTPGILVRLPAPPQFLMAAARTVAGSFAGGEMDAGENGYATRTPRGNPDTRRHRAK